MAKRRRETDDDGTTSESEEYNTVFVDTSLGTYLAMIVSNSDTVSDFKKKIVMEHMKCFPETGDIQIHSLKVKHRGNFYHLPDIMLVWSAFVGVKRKWFLSADASGTTTGCLLKQKSPELGTSNGVRMELMNIDDDCRGLSSDDKRITTLAMSLLDGVSEKNVVPEKTAGLEVYKSSEMTKYIQSNNYSDENYAGVESRAKKKRRMSHKEDVYHNPSSNDICSLIHASCQDTSKPKNSLVDEVKEGPEGVVLYEQQGKPTMSEATAEVSGVRKDQSNTKDVVEFEGTSLSATADKSNLGSIVNSQEHLESIIPENITATKPESKLDQNGPTSDGVASEVPNLSARLTDVTNATADANTYGKKRKKKKAQKTPENIQDTSDMEQTRKGESVEPCTEETHKSQEKEGEKELNPNQDHELIIPPYNKASDGAGQDLTVKEASFSPQILDANVMEPEIHSGSRRKKKTKKREKKFDETNLEKSGMKQTDNVMSGSSGVLNLSTDHIHEEADKGESLLNHKEKNVQMKLLDSSAEDASEKAMGANINNTDFVTPARTKKTVGDADTSKKKMRKKTKSSASNCDADLPAPEKETKIVEKKFEEINLKESSMGQTDNGVSGSSGLLHPSTDLIPEETDKGQSILNHKEENVQMKLLDSSAGDAGEKARGADINEGDFVTSTQTEQTLGDVDTAREKMQEKTKSSAGNLHADLPAPEKEIKIVEFSQEEKNSENTENKVKKSRKKTKKSKPTASDVQEKLPINDQKLGSEVLAPEQNSSTFVNSEQGHGHVASSQVQSHKSEEKLEEMQVTAVNSDDKVKKAKRKTKKSKLTVSDAQEKLPIKDQKASNGVLATEQNSSTFVNSEQERGQVASSQVQSHKSEKKLEEMHVTSVNGEDLATPSENKGDGINFKQYFVPGQDQDKIDYGNKMKKATKLNEEMKTAKRVKEHGLSSVTMSTENQENGTKSRVRKASGKRNPDSAQNSDRSEVNPSSGHMTLQKPNEILAPKEKNTSLEKPSSGRSEKFPKNKADKGLQSVLNEMLFKTPKKKSLLLKSEAIFQDNSGESSGGENGNVLSDASTLSPSDSSEGESDESENSTRNGPNDSKGRSMSNLDLSASNEITMDMILKSSKRYKKAKLQIESQEVEEFVPDSLPNP